MLGKFLGLVIIAVVAASCSGGNDDATPGVATLTPTTDTVVGVDPLRETEEQARELVQCLRNEGVNVPDPTITGDGNIRFSPPADFGAGDLGTLQTAADACADLIEGLDIGFQNIDLTTITDNLLVFASCMRDNGYDIRDPDFSLFVPGPDGSVPTGGPFGDLDFTDPGFIAAFPACQELLNNLGTPPDSQPSG